ncbi:hypothetical protein BDM02DRAFT_962923 [Thelephora ganbajun]|uniref:Uncharacterized protein n=1 Tax=Thelephora ganbajun TaxID=370292 RepID=A0ACB6ZNJ5_THEGA|nr:hypothetical protein BDM02DRAFT_962923 [Thelephora ganbajun]
MRISTFPPIRSRSPFTNLPVAKILDPLRKVPMDRTRRNLLLKIDESHHGFQKSSDCDPVICFCLYSWTFFKIPSVIAPGLLFVLRSKLFVCPCYTRQLMDMIVFRFYYCFFIVIPLQYFFHTLLGGGGVVRAVILGLPISI